MRHDPVRDEAERLIAAAVAAVSMAARGIPRTIANGSEECCVCPVCRVIASMRDPSAEMTDRLAAGAGELATAVTGVLRMLSRGGATPSRPVDVEDDPGREGDEFWETMRRKAADAARGAAESARAGAGGDDPWRQATTNPATRPMAKKAVAKKAVVKKAAGPPPDEPEPPGHPPQAAQPVQPTRPAKKAVAKKAVAKKTVAKKAATKAVPPAEPESD